MPTTRCKFHCANVKAMDWGGVEVELNAVSPNETTDGYAHGENHAFFNATPSGSLRMTITNAYGAELFQPGDDYYLDVTKAPKRSTG